MSHPIGVLCTLTMLFAAAVLGSGSGCGLLECRGGYIWTPGIGPVPCPQCNTQGGAR